MMYVEHLKAGRVDGQAVPALRVERPGAVVVDACDGFAFAACELAVAEAIARSRAALRLAR